MDEKTFQLRTDKTNCMYLAGRIGSCRCATCYSFKTYRTLRAIKFRAEALRHIEPANIKGKRRAQIQAALHDACAY